MRFVLEHKVVSVICLALAVVAGYFGWQKLFPEEAEIHYVTAKVEKGTLVSSISGTGQILPLSQVEIKSKASGKVTLVKVKNNQAVKEGDILIQTDARESALSYNQAKVSLDMAKLDLQEMISPVSELELTQAENSLQKLKEDLEKLKLNQEISAVQALESKQKTIDSLEKSYEDAYNSVSSVFLDLPDTIGLLAEALNGKDIGQAEYVCNDCSNADALGMTFYMTYDNANKEKFTAYVEDAKNSYLDAKNAYDKNFESYKEISRYSEKTETEAILIETAETVKKTADALKAVMNVYDFWEEYRNRAGMKIYSGATDMQNDLSSSISKNNSHLSSILSAQRSIQDGKESIADAERDSRLAEMSNPMAIAQAERNIKEQELKLIDLKKGPTNIEIENQRLTVKQKENSLSSAAQTLSEHTVRAPFAGTIVDFAVNRGDEISANETVCTVLTSQKIAEITLNEVDVAKVELGQRTTLTFDAIEDLTITGEVAEIDSLGEVSSGVVSYKVKILFDVQDDRVKPNMTVSANIILESKPDILLISSSAVKIQGDNYVEVLAEGKPIKKLVVVGSSNDTLVEIKEGLSEGDEVITQTISSSDSQTSSASSGGSSQRTGAVRIEGGMGFSPGMFRQ